MVAGVLRRQPNATTWLQNVLADQRLKSTYPSLGVAGLVLYFLLLIRTVAETATVY